MSEKIDLFLDEVNNLDFNLQVEGSERGEVDCKLIIENSNISYGFKGNFKDSSTVNVEIPKLKNTLSEGDYSAHLQVCIDDRIFKPLMMEITFKHAITVKAESVKPTIVSKGPKASFVRKSKILSEKKASEATGVKKDDRQKKISRTKKALKKKGIDVDNLVSESDLKSFISKFLKD